MIAEVVPYVRCHAQTRAGRQCKNLVPNSTADWSLYNLDADDTEQMRQGRCHVHLIEYVAPVIDLTTRRVTR